MAFKARRLDQVTKEMGVYKKEKKGLKPKVFQ